MDFTKVITHPLGLSGFALALVFGIAGIFARQGNKAPKWLPVVAVTLAAVCLAGGLLVAYNQTTPPQPVRTTPSQRVEGENVAVTHGDCAPAQAGVAIGGSVNTNCNRPAASEASASDQ